MNKTDLINKIAENASLSKKDAGAALEGTIKAITDALAQGEDVSILGFGTFAVKERAEREGRNPATGEKMVFSKSKSVAFRVGKTLKQNIQ